MMMKRIVALGVVVCVVVVGMLALTPKAEATAFASGSQVLLMYSSGLSMTGQFRFSTGSWIGSTGGGFGYYDAPYSMGWNVWYGMVIHDYVTGNYSDITYIYEDQL